MGDVDPVRPAERDGWYCGTACHDRSATLRTIPTTVLTAPRHPREDLEARGFAALMTKPLAFDRLAAALVNGCQAGIIRQPVEAAGFANPFISAGWLN